MVYKEYLNTEHWRATRKRALLEVGGKCQLCGEKTKLNVHHNSYDRLWYEGKQDLVVLCDVCHKAHHEKIPLPPKKIVQNYNFWPVVSLSDGRKIHCPEELKEEERAYVKKIHR